MVSFGRIFRRSYGNKKPFNEKPSRIKGFINVTCPCGAVIKFEGLIQPTQEEVSKRCLEACARFEAKKQKRIRQLVGDKK